MERQNTIMKNTPIFKKKIIDLMDELNLTPSEALVALEPLCELLRKRSRLSVQNEVNDWKKKKGIARIKTDY